MNRAPARCGKETQAPGSHDSGPDKTRRCLRPGRRTQSARLPGTGWPCPLPKARRPPTATGSPAAEAPFAPPRPRQTKLTRHALRGIGWFGSWLAVDGQPDLKTGLAGPGFKFDFAAMTVSDDAVADDETQASAGADGFRGEKRLEHPSLHLRRNAGAIIHDFDDYLVVFQARADTDFAGAVYGDDGVINQIGPHLIEFAAISRNARHRAIKRPNQRHVFQFVTEHGQSALDTFVDVHLLHRRLIHVRIGFDGFD